ncbi:hypothetical protein VTK26DRAFT_565 [Humicola hyalothermophila]
MLVARESRRRLSHTSAPFCVRETARLVRWTCKFGGSERQILGARMMPRVAQGFLARRLPSRLQSGLTGWQLRSSTRHHRSLLCTLNEVHQHTEASPVYTLTPRNNHKLSCLVSLTQTRPPTVAIQEEAWRNISASSLIGLGSNHAVATQRDKTIGSLSADLPNTGSHQVRVKRLCMGSSQQTVRSL